MRNSTLRLCRAGVIAALYVALTMSFGALAYNGVFQIRPGEALAVLPLFYPEAVPALWIGCMIANIISPFALFDITLGGAVTLVAAAFTYLIGRLVRNDVLRVALGGLSPVLLNAFIMPLVIVYMAGGSYESAAAEYWVEFVSMLVTEAVWIYALGGLLYFGVGRLRKRGVRAFLDDGYGKKKPAKEDEPPAGEDAGTEEDDEKKAP